MLVIIVILIGLLKNKKKLIYIAICTLYIISTPIFSNSFFRLIEGSEYRKPIKIIDSADAIVVLSGMLGINQVGNSTYIEWGDPDRLFAGIALYKAGKAQKLIFTGGKLPWDKAKKTEGEVLKEFAISNSIPSKNIFVTKEVNSTEDESIAIKELIRPSRKIILVTSSYHMYRAKMLFENQGLKVIPFKVDYKASRNNQNTVMDILPSANNLEITEIGIREIIGRIFYFILN
jgi:uncharacterized SAM-binding protein YcdF (DUF218 family)